MPKITKEKQNQTNIALPPFEWEALLTWYSEFGRTTTWREWPFLDIYSAGYRVYLFEIFSQQTQAARAQQYVEKVVQAFPTIHDLARADYSDFFPLYQGLGYYSRAKNILLAVRQVVEKYDGIFPNDESLLLALPWVGPYSARAILAFLYNEKVLAWDTNVKKVFTRYYMSSRFASLDTLIQKNLEEQMKKLSYSGRDINNALMDFAAFGQDESMRNGFLQYPFIRCAFLQTEGKKEQQEEQIKKEQKRVNSVNKKIVQPNKLWVVLHENHQHYFFDGTIFGAWEFDKNTSYREEISHFFATTYQLAVSVRPPRLHKTKDNEEVYVCFCQIQQGSYSFGVFNKKDTQDYFANI